jgi:transposase-like protein
MPKHKSEEYKINAVRYYLGNNTTYMETCEIFECSERSLKRWIERYQDENSIKRHMKEFYINIYQITESIK